ncbi:tandem-95 repeat protein [Microvirga sp. P5_D2]
MTLAGEHLGLLIGGENRSRQLVLEGTADHINAALSSLAYNSGGNAVTNDTLTISISDGIGTDTGQVAITVQNTAPELSASVTSIVYTDTVWTDQFHPTNGQLSSSDLDPLDPKIYGIESGAASSSLAGYDQAAVGNYGTLYLNTTTGSYVFQPDGRAIETLKADISETFTLFVTDGLAITTETITVDIAAVDDGPVAVEAIPDQSVREDTAWSYQIPANCFTDADDDVVFMAAALAHGDPLPSWLTFDPGTRSFSGTPPLNFNDSLDIAVIANDWWFGAARFTLTVTSVNDKPTVAYTNTVTTSEDTASAAIAIGATDPDGDRLAYSLKTGAGPQSGSVTINQTDGTFRYTPAANAHGQDSFTILVSDGVEISEQVVSVIVTPVGDAPIPAADGNFVLGEEDTILTGSLPVGSDPDGDALTYELVTPLAGLALNPNGTFTYTPSREFSGSVGFEYKIVDSSGAESAPVHFGIKVNAVNDAPVATDDEATAAEEGQIEIDVLANDVDGDGPKKYISDVKLDQGQGFIGIVQYDYYGGSRVLFTGAKDFVGDVIITYTVTDGILSDEGQVVVTVTPVNDAPVVSTLTLTTVEDVALSFVATGDFDPDGDRLSYAVKSGTAPRKGTVSFADDTFTYTPNQNASGPDSFTILVSDGHGGLSEQAVSVTIKPVNDAPTAVLSIAAQSVAEDAFWSFQLPSGTFVDIDSSLVYSATLTDGTALPLWLHFHPATQSFWGTPPHFNGTLDLKVTAGDGTLTASQLFTLTVTPVNDAPVVASTVRDQLVAEDGHWSFQVPADTFTDIDSDLTFTATLADGSALPAWLTFDPTTQTLSGIPPLNFNGLLGLKITATDGEFSVADTFNLTVTPVNDPPSGLHLLTSTVHENSSSGTVVGSLLGLDPELGDTLSYTLLDDAGGRFSLQGDRMLVANGSLLDYEQASSHQVLVRVADQSGATLDRAFTIFLADINEAPLGIFLRHGMVAENSSMGTAVGTLLATDADARETFTFSLMDDAGGRFRIEHDQLVVANGTLLDHEQAKSHQVIVRVTDGGGASLVQSLWVSVADVLNETSPGTAGRDHIVGGTGRDKLSGGLGNDVLTGGAGKDTFVFNTKLGTSRTDRMVNFDQITDFNVTDDSIQLDNAIFKKLGTGTPAKPKQLAKAFFTIGDKAKDTNDYLIYNSRTGVLSYDVDASGKGIAVEFAVLKKSLKVTEKDFFII